VQHNLEEGNPPVKPKVSYDHKWKELTCGVRIVTCDGRIELEGFAEATSPPRKPSGHKGLVAEISRKKSKQKENE
jgi:hypothetical protein